MRLMRRLKRGQRGFTLVELLVAIPIAGIVLAAATAGLMSLGNSRDASTHMYSLRQVQTAGYWVSTDGYQSYEVTFGASAGFPLILQWRNIETLHSGVVTYTLGGDAGGPRTLVRNEIIRDDTDNSVISNTTMTVARYLLDSVQDPATGAITSATFCRPGAAGEAPLIFQVTAQVGREPAEQRTYDITLRPQVMGQVRL